MVFYALQNRNSENIWKKMASLGSIAVTFVFFLIFNILGLICLTVPMKLKNKKCRAVYVILLVSWSAYFYYNRFYTSASKTRWTLDSYYLHNAPYDPKNPPQLAENP